MYAVLSRITFEGLPTPLPLGSFEFLWLELGNLRSRISHLMKQSNRWSRSSKESQRSQSRQVQQLDVQKSNHKKRNGRQKSYSPPAQVCYFRSLSYAAIVMKETGQTLLKKGSSNTKPFNTAFFLVEAFMLL
jgi:hypothetical protein